MQVNDYLHLLALHRVFLEAKFHGSPRDRMVPYSPYVATLANSTYDSILEVLSSEGRNAEKKEWESWRSLNEQSREFESIKKLILSFEGEWIKLSVVEKEHFVRRIISPFTATNDQVGQLIAHKDNSIGKIASDGDSN